MEGKDVLKVPGIGRNVAALLNAEGIYMAIQLYEDHFLKKTKEEFKAFLKSFKSDKRNQNYTYDAMKGWHDQHGDIKENGFNIVQQDARGGQ